jgi:Fe-Mn family superoxide dismutase
MEHTLPPLPYPKDGLAPHISRETIDFHYGKHHQAYVTNLNKLIKGTDYADLDLEALIRTAQPGGVFNNAAQAWNHTFFWHSMKPSGGAPPAGALATAIDAKWGSFGEFHKAFESSAISNFGSGWTWLVKKMDNSLDIVNTSNANTPLAGADTPLLTIDVWEHAYYIDYRNQRPKFVEMFLEKLADWEFAASNFSKSPRTWSARDATRRATASATSAR